MAKNPISRQAPSMAAATRQRSSRPPWRAGATSISGTFVMDQSVEKTEPPSTMSVWPLMKALSSDARKTTAPSTSSGRSEEHTSELQSHHDLVCRLLLEKKKI